MLRSSRSLNSGFLEIDEFISLLVKNECEVLPVESLLVELVVEHFDLSNDLAVRGSLICRPAH